MGKKERMAASILLTREAEQPHGCGFCDELATGRGGERSVQSFAPSRYSIAAASPCSIAISTACFARSSIVFDFARAE